MDNTNCFVLDTVDPDEVGTVSFDNMPRRITVPPYTQRNIKGNSLDPDSDFVGFVLSLEHKTNKGIHIDLQNSDLVLVI